MSSDETPVEPTSDAPYAGEGVRVVLAEGRARPAWAGHPDVYEGAITAVEGVPGDGDEVDVVDARGRFIGRGVWNGSSAVRVRIYRRTPGPIDAAFLARRVRQAVRLRREVLRLDDVASAWRVVHGVGDQLPGVVADRYGDHVVLQVTTRAAADRRGALAEALLAALGARGVVERPAAEFAKREGFHPGGGRLAGEAPPDDVEVVENGVRHLVDLAHGQKTGLFLDQRDNRARFAALARGRRVLDVFSGTGGFGLSALVGGATGALAIDVSARALARLRENAARNAVAERLEAREGDGFDALRALAESPERFDAVSVDPPRFATSRRELPGALRGYAELNLRAIEVVAPGGILATSSCTGVLEEQEFLRMLRDTALRARRRVQVLYVGGQAPDHPWTTAAPEGRYLKHVVARVLSS